MDDDELIASLAGGDDSALRELFTRHAPWLATRLRAVLPPSDVEDVLQETFLAVWQNARTYRPQGQAGGWLWVIARRQAALLLRRRGPAAGPLVQDAAEPGADPAEAALARADLDAAASTLQSLEREVWRLMYVEDRPVAEVAELTGVPPGHGEEPRAPGPAHAAHGAGRRYPMSAPDDVDLNRVWAAVAAEVWRRYPGRLERTAARVLRSPGLARALLTTPSLLVPWLLSTVVVFGVGALLRLGPGQPAVWLLAPALAAVGIAYAYGPGVDPAWELGYSMAVSERMILLTRAVAVFAVNAVLGLAASAASGAVASLTFGWLLPMTAICGLTLAVAVAARSATVGAVGGVAAWVITVLANQTASGQLTATVTDTETYLPYLAAAVAAVAAVAYVTRPQRGLQ
jgi:RNA polymerase sigma factor (sigma-70 family)